MKPMNSTDIGVLRFELVDIQMPSASRPAVSLMVSSCGVCIRPHSTSR